MSKYDPEKIRKLAHDMAAIAQASRTSLPDAPRPRQIVPEDFAPVGLCATEREWFCEHIRFLARVYELGWFVRQECRGYAGLESLPDDELKRVFKRVGHAVSCIKDGISFEDAGLIEY